MSTQRANSKPVAWLAASLMLLASIISITAAADTDSDKWKFDADIYLWGAGIKATTATGGDIDIPFHQVIKDLDMAFMGGRRGLQGQVVTVRRRDLPGYISRRQLHGVDTGSGSP